jgi:histone deacetylase 11
MAESSESRARDRVWPRVVYTRRYNIGFFGLERLHPFDSRKYGRAWGLLRRKFGSGLKQHAARPLRAVSRPELLRVHTAEYLDQLRDSNYVARALELPILAKVPARLLDHFVLRPMRWGAAGTVLAARLAIDDAVAINLSGGYHHAKPTAGEGFCIYGDVALAIDALRRDGLLAADDRVVHIDLDAHQGNGVCHFFVHDRAVFLFDVYNAEIYPAYDREARSRIDCDVPLPGNATETEYLKAVTSRLPAFLDSVRKTHPIRLAIYNAGSDIYEHDTLGGLRVSSQGIVSRDWFVVEQLLARRIPTVLLLSGGYHRDSYRIIADSLVNIFERTQ